MGRHFALALQLPAYRSRQQKQKAAETQRYFSALNSQRLGIIVFALLVVSVGMYLFQVNSFSTKGYVISQLQDSISKQQDQYSNLQLEAAQLQSIQRIQTSTSTVSMVPVTQINYIQTTSLTQR